MGPDQAFSFDRFPANGMGDVHILPKGMFAKMT
jgi:hypothetical protein